MKKKILMGISYVLLIALVITGTVAYFTDTDSAVNVMTVGKIDIEQLEYQRAEGVAHTGTATEGSLVPFVQGQLLMPAFPVNNLATDYTAEPYDLFYWGPYVTADAAGNGLWNDNKLGNVMDKMVFVKNTGKNDAYYRTIFAFECPKGMEYSEGANEEFMMNTNLNHRFEWENVDYITIDGVRYLLVLATYKEVLAPEEISRPSLLQVVMTDKATQEQAALLGDTYEILVYTQAVQADMGVAMDADTALDAAFGDITAANHPWINTVMVQADDEKELKDALTSGKDVVLNTDIVGISDAAFDGNDTTVTLAGVGDDTYGYLAFTPGKGEDTTVENLNVTGSGFVEVGHYGEGGGDYVVNNLKIENLQSTLCVNDNGNKVSAAFAHYGNAVLNDCVMTGTTTADKSYTAYDAGFVNGTKTTINGGAYGKLYIWAQAHVTVKDATIDVIDSAAITYKNFGKLTIGANAKVGTVNLVCLDAYTPSLVIEDGAEVGAIVYKGVTYTQAEWMNR